jgi:PAS domain S-box-containing protein
MYSSTAKIIPQESSHAVQFYDQDTFLKEKLKCFIEEGLALGEAVVILATPTHREDLASSSPGYRAHKGYWELDAADTLAQLSSNGHVDRMKFHAVMGQLLQQATNTGNGRIRIFGEMVALLWEKGQPDDALHLEHLWNELAVHHSFSLLCAYHIRSFSSPHHTQAFQKICHYHSMIRPAEMAVGLEREDRGDWASTLALLQQKSMALEGEVVRRQEIEQALRQRDEELVDFLENAVECVHQVGPDGEILWANKAELAMLGYETHEYIGHNVREFYPDQAVIEDILQRLLQGETLHNFQARLRCKDGSVKDVLIHSNGRWEYGSFRYTRCFTRDITERKRIEEELDQRVAERTRELVESQQKLRALAAELSRAENRVRKNLSTELHDYLAQLLVVTRLKLVQATQEAEGYPKIQPLLTEVDDHLHESILYTRSLMAELNPPTLEFGLPMGLRWLAEKKFRKHNLTVDVDIPDDLDIPLSEDQTGMLFQSVRELLMNVIKHAQVDRAQVSLRLRENLLYLEVSDQGKGFEPGALPSSLSAQQDLIKFGLFSLRERMEALGGRLEIHSSPNRGTRATLVLPLAPAQDTVPPREGTPSTVAPAISYTKISGMVRVLLVEDHAVVREGLRGVLGAYLDIQVVAEAGDGEEAIAQAESYRPDVIIMDISLPKFNGIEATRRIKVRLPETIVIGLSTHQANYVEPALRDAGGTAFVTKESAAASLYEAIQTAVGKPRHSHSPAG